MDKQMKILERKIKNRKKYSGLKVAFAGLISGALVIALCVCTAVWYRSSQKTYSTSEVSVQDKADASDSNVSKNNKKSKSQVDLKALKDEYVSFFNERHPEATLSFIIKDLNTGDTALYNSKQMNSASVIKLFIMETVLRQTQKGEYDLSAEKEKSLEVMITNSDNDAANLFIDDFGGVDDTRRVTDKNLINRTISDFGYSKTQLNRKMYNSTPPGGPTGYENYTCVEDVARLLEGIYNNTLFEGKYNTQAMTYLKAQNRRGKIPAKISLKYPHVVVANKTGELSQVENDAAIIMGEDYSLILVIMVNDIPKRADGSTDYALKEKVQQTISELALMLVDKYEKINFE